MNRKKARPIKTFEAPRYIVEALSFYAPPEDISVSDWAAAERVLDSRSSYMPGKWRNSITPYLTEIMDAWSDPAIEKIVFCKGSQLGGTEAILNCIGYTIREDPAPSMVVYPTDDLGKSVRDNRILPMIEASPGLRERYDPYRSSKDELQFETMYLTITGSNSPSGLASRPIRNLWMDEIDKYPGATKKEADPLSLAEERTKTFQNRNIFLTSTPTIRNGPIWRAKEAADEERHYFIPCPHCGEMIELKFVQIKWPGKDSRLSYAERAEQAVYVCQECGCTLTDADKVKAVARGEWRPVRSSGQSARSVAFWLPSVYSPFVRFSDVARKFMDSKDDQEKLHNFVNSWLAEPWEDTKLTTSADLVMERRTETPSWILPEWTKLLTGGVDVQENCLYWTIRAWGDFITSQNVAHGQAFSFEEIVKIFNTEFVMPDGSKRLVDLALIDSGDQTDDVYDFAVQNADLCLPCKGQATMLSHYKLSTVNKATSRAYGMTLVLVDVGKYKDMIAARMRKPNGKGSWMVAEDCDLEYAEQVTSEQKIEETSGGRSSQRWVLKSSHADNHYLDTEVYAMAAADIRGVRSLFLDQLQEQPAPAPKPEPKKQDPNERAWIQNINSWL